jgi:hypothetical protein
MTERALQELCPRCVYAADCAAQKRSGGEVRCCDRFRPLGAPADNAAEPSVARSISLTKPQGAGLCRTCGRNGTCGRRSAEGGVWRCADYL